jgi:transposase
MTYSIELVKCASNLYRNKHKYNMNINDILKFTNIARSTLYSWINNKELLNSNKRKKQRRNKNLKVTEKCKDYIIEYMTMNKNNNNVKKLKQNIRRLFKIKISKSHIYNILRDKRISYKKMKEDHCPYTNEKLKEKAIEVKNQVDAVKQKLIYLDESSVEISLRKKYGWSKKGTKCTIKNIHGKHYRVSLLFAITTHGILTYTLKKGSFNAKTFKRFLKYKFNKNLNGYKFFMDNAKIHHAKIIDQELKQKIIYNVPYHSELNPIEMVFNTFKKYISSKNINSITTLRKHINIFIKNINQNGLKEYINKSYNLLNDLCQ